MKQSKRKYDKKRHILYTQQLGFSYMAARVKLARMIMIKLIFEAKKNICYRCNKIIETEKDLTIDHKEQWFNINPDLFWNYKNIAFSHYGCNSSHSRGKFKKKESGSVSAQQETV